jgi:diguanylate cyclase (GGDEF)-like protein
VLLVGPAATALAALPPVGEAAPPAPFSFQSAATAAAALAVPGAERPDCVVLDLLLADAAVPATLTALRAALPGVPVIGLVPHDAEPLAAHALLSGIDECLECDGLDRDTLCRLVEHCLARRMPVAPAAVPSFRDPLTGLAGRAEFEDALTRAMARADRSGLLLALVLLDLDGFGAVNAALGYDGGDAVLRTVAQRFLGEIRLGDVIARLDGDAFAFILENLPTRASAAVVARKLLATLVAPVLVGADAVSIGCSIGIAFQPEDGATRAGLEQSASAALAAARRHGGGRIGSLTGLLSSVPAGERAPAPRAVDAAGARPVLLAAVGRDPRRRRG